MVSWRQQMIPEFNQKGANQKPFGTPESVASSAYAVLLRQFIYELDIANTLRFHTTFAFIWSDNQVAHIKTTQLICKWTQTTGRRERCQLTDLTVLFERRKNYNLVSKRQILRRLHHLHSHFDTNDLIFRLFVQSNFVMLKWLINHFSSLFTLTFIGTLNMQFP